ncbi:MAG: DMT family transporter [Acidiferrobacterales bacterium]
MGLPLGCVQRLVSKSAKRSRESDGSDRARLRGTLFIASIACVTHAVMVVTGQAAVPIYGELQTLWLARLISFASILVLLAFRTTAPKVPLRWWPLLGLQGCLDAAGYLFLFAGSYGEGREIAAVTASTFGAVTTLLARVVLREHISPVQWVGIVLVFGGIAVLVSPP